MENLPSISFTSFIASLAAVLGAAWSAQELWRHFRKDKDKDADKILKQAGEALELSKAELAAKIEALEVKVNNLESSVKKDLDHLKENYTNEIRALAEKINLLRQDLHDQHAQLLDILSSLIKK